MQKKRTMITANKSELKAFLKYFYYVEEIAQGEGYNTSKHWTEKAREFHDKLLKAEHEIEE